MASADPTPHCPNCSSDLSGSYCSECGQRQIDLDRPFREIVGEGLSTILAFDTRLVRTLLPLIRRPGYLTREFMAGRRARYVHPFKLYFAFSLVFFLVFSFSSYSIVKVNEPGVVTIQSFESEVPDPAAEGVPPVPETMAESGEEEEDGAEESFFGPLAEIAKNDPERLNRLFFDRLSKTLIILVPIVALLLQALYWKPRYVAHLVFALHLHSFAFLVLVIGALVDRVGVTGELGNNAATLAIVIYTFLALRRVYEQRRLTTVAKQFALILGYVVALVVTMMATFVATIAAI